MQYRNVKNLPKGGYDWKPTESEINKRARKQARRIVRAALITLTVFITLAVLLEYA